MSCTYVQLTQGLADFRPFTKLLGPVFQLCACYLIMLESVCHLESKLLYWVLVMKCMGFLVSIAGQKGSPILHSNIHILISCPHCLTNRQPQKVVRASVCATLGLQSLELE